MYIHIITYLEAGGSHIKLPHLAWMQNYLQSYTPTKTCMCHKNKKKQLHKNNRIIINPFFLSRNSSKQIEELADTPHKPTLLLVMVFVVMMVFVIVTVMVLVLVLVPVLSQPLFSLHVWVVVVPHLHVLVPLSVIILAVEPGPNVAEPGPHLTCPASDLRNRTRIFLVGYDHVVSVRDHAVREARAQRLELVDVVFTAVMAATVSSTGG